MILVFIMMNLGMRNDIFNNREWAAEGTRGGWNELMPYWQNGLQTNRITTRIVANTAQHSGTNTIFWWMTKVARFANSRSSADGQATIGRWSLRFLYEWRKLHASRIPVHLPIEKRSLNYFLENFQITDVKISCSQNEHVNINSINIKI